MVKNLKFVELPPELYGVIEIKSNKDSKKQEPDKPENFKKFLYNEKSYIPKFDRLIDPVLISMFYGLYVSKKLPDTDQPLELYKKREFGVNISSYWDIFSHLLFCLWLQINGYPNESTDVLEYRKVLYKFIGDLLNEEYFCNTIIPFYLNEASKDENGCAFLHNMKQSSFVEFKNSMISPEYLAMEFQTAQEDYEKEVIRPLFGKITPSSEIIGTESFTQDFKKYLHRGEDQFIEFKSSALWSEEMDNKAMEISTSKEVHKYGKDASKFIIARSIASFLNSEGGNLIIGIKENKETGKDEIIGVKSEFGKLKDRNIDGYKRKLLDDIIRKYFEDDIYNNVTKYIKINFPEVDSKTLCWLIIKKSDKRVFIKTKKNMDIFFIRTDSETREITGQELVDYCNQRFK